MKKYYIAKRTFQRNFGKKLRLKFKNIEIVTMDKYICPQLYDYKYMDGIEGTASDPKVFDTMDISTSYQIILFIEVNTSNYTLEEVQDYSFCGFDIVNLNEDESILINYGIPYEGISGECISKYGLLKSLKCADEYIGLNLENYPDLQNNGYKIYAVYRRVISPGK